MSRIILTPVIILSFIICSAQDDSKVACLQERVAAAQLRVEKADSLSIEAERLIDEGNVMMREAESELKVLAQVEKAIVRDHFNERRTLERGLKSSDKDKANEAKAALKELGKKEKVEFREWNTNYKASVKKYDNGKKLTDKGKANLKKAKAAKKEAEKKLREAEKKLNSAL